MTNIGFLLNSAIRISSAFFALVAQYFYVNNIGPVSYGNYSIYITVISFICIFSKFGSEPAVIRLSAVADVLPKAEGLYIGWVILISAFVLAPTSAALYFFVKGVVHFGFLGLILGSAVLTFSSLVVSILRGGGHLLLADIIDNLTRPIIMLTAAYILFKNNAYENQEIIAAYIFSGVLASIVIVGFLVYKMPYIKINKFNFSHFKKYSGEIYSAKQVMVAVCFFVIYQLDTYILSFAASAQEVGGYNVASNYVRLVVFFPMIIAARSQKDLAVLFHENDIKKFRILLYKSCKKSLAFSIAALLFMMVFAEKIMTVTSGAYSGMGWILIILSIGHVFNSIGLNCISALNMAAKNKLSLISSAVGAIIALIGYLVGYRYGGMVIAGAAALGMAAMTCVAAYFVFVINGGKNELLVG